MARERTHCSDRMSFQCERLWYCSYRSRKPERKHDIPSWFSSAVKYIAYFWQHAAGTALPVYNSQYKNCIQSALHIISSCGKQKDMPCYHNITYLNLGELLQGKHSTNTHINTNIHRERDREKWFLKSIVWNVTKYNVEYTLAICWLSLFKCTHCPSTQIRFSVHTYTRTIGTRNAQNRGPEIFLSVCFLAGTHQSWIALSIFYQFISLNVPYLLYAPSQGISGSALVRVLQSQGGNLNRAKIYTPGYKNVGVSSCVYDARFHNPPTLYHTQGS